MQISDLFARLFSGSGPRGLSGEADMVLPNDPDHAFFNEGLRKHRAESDLVSNPEVLWGDPRQSNGLLQHLTAERPRDGVARFTDILIILNDADWKRSLENVIEPWTNRASWVLSRRFKEFCNEQDLHVLFAQRTVGFRFIEDGGEEMGGEYLSLEPGEFVTGLLSNQYTEPQQGSKKLISVHVNLPGVWEGYQEVGTFHNDRILYTLGSHWLDSFQHPALKIPALYRLQQYADGSFVHIIHPDYQDSYEISSHGGDGPSVLTLAEKGGRALAHMVLALADEEQAHQADAPMPARNPTLIDMLGSGTATVIPDVVDERILTLKERGALLQKVHFGRFMDGYDVYIGPKGKVSTQIPGERAATIQVRRNMVTLLSHRDDVEVNGERMRQGAERPLQGNLHLKLGGVDLEYKDLTRVKVDGWPYLGELVRPSGSSYMVFGGVYKVGRDRKNKMRLPDEPNNSNIVWRPEMAAGGTIRSRTGSIPKSRFYTDSIMVASEHAQVDLTEEPVIQSLARHCYTYVRRQDTIVPLVPTQAKAGATKADLQAGDHILIGNCAFEVTFPPPGRQPSAAMETFPPPLSAEELAQAAETSPDDAAPPMLVEADTVDEPPQISASLTIGSPPVAAGLGERGPPPPRPNIEVEEGDSIIQEAAVEIPTEELPFIAPPMLLDDEESIGDPSSDVMQELAHSEGLVAVVDESEWQLELSRPAKLRLEGWMVSGELQIANHRGAQVVIPENRSQRGQVFQPTEYFELFVRGRRGRLALLTPTEASLEVEGGPRDATEDLSKAQLSIVRRAPDGEVDFDVQLTLSTDRQLPDPRAMRLNIDTEDPMVEALVTIGLPLRASREVELGPIRALATFDGDQVQISDYLATYKQPMGTYHPFFVRHGDGAFQTVPEDGSTVTMKAGDQLLAGGAIYTLRS